MPRHQDSAFVLAWCGARPSHGAGVLRVQTSHWRQYPPKTTKVYSYFESRGGKFKECTFFGLQYMIKRYLVGQVGLRLSMQRREGRLACWMPRGWFLGSM